MGGFGSSNFTGSNIASGSGKSGDSAPSITIPTDLPGGIATPAALATKINDRFRQLRGLLATFWRNPATSNYSMGGPGQPYQINNLADPVADLDAVNLRTLKKFNAPPAAPRPPASYNYSICFSEPGTLTTGEVFAPYKVAIGKQGSVIQVWFDCLTPPVADCTINFMVQLPSKAWAALLTNDALLPAGSSGGVVTDGFAITYFPYLTRIYMVVTSGGSAAAFTGGVDVQTTPAN